MTAYLYLLMKFWRELILLTLAIMLSISVVSCQNNARTIKAVKADCQLQQITDRAEYEAKARQIEQDNYKRFADAQNQYEQKQSQIINDYHDAVTANNSLLDTLNSIESNIANLPEQTRAIYRDTQTDVLAECTTALVDLAATTDRINADRDRLYQAWPTN